MKQKIPIVYIEWLDHTSKSEWQDKDDIDKIKPASMRSIGYLVGQDEQCYKVAGESADDGDYGNVTAILKSAVVKFRKLKIRLP